MRARKLIENPDNELLALKNAFELKRVAVVYSSAHLKEISQIPSEEYRAEHISLLNSLGAVYIAPLSNQLVRKDAWDIWHEYIGNEKSNARYGDPVYWQTMINRKLCGIPIEKSFSELHLNLKTSLVSMIENALKELDAIPSAEVIEIGREKVVALRKNLEGQMMGALQIQALDIPDDAQLGPKPFREICNFGHIGNIEPEAVIPAIEDLFFQENPSFNFYQYLEETEESKIAIYYSLLNWAGYHADDFTSQKKKKDRFNASANDLMHVQSAAKCGWLISSDAAFLAKASAIYKHLGIKTVACSPEHAVANLCGKD
jgi:hypothetical protein